ncbi:MAG: sensor histidine kinase [Bacteroidota bacterium]
MKEQGKAPENQESGRIKRLKEYDILDTLPEEDFDNITRIASAICQTPIALISLVDTDRQWFKSAIGLKERETPLEVSFCAHAIRDPEHVLTVTDATKDSRFAQMESVTGPLGVRFYTGVPLVDAKGYALGTLCIIDNKPRLPLSTEQETTLQALASQVMRLLELRIRNKELQAVSDKLLQKTEELHQFALTLSHDIKSPLTGMQQLAELVKERLPEDADQRVKESVDMIRSTGIKLQDMIGSVLDYYQLGEHSNSEAETIEVDLFLREIAALALDPLKARYEVEVHADSVHFKKPVLQIVLMNLLENAYRHNSNDDLFIRITATDKTGNTLIAVSDNGQGMNEERLRSLSRGFQTNIQKDRFGRKSHGLGLAKVRKLLEAENIDLKVESSSGKWSCFYFEIPAHVS